MISSSFFIKFDFRTKFITIKSRYMSHYLYLALDVVKFGVLGTIIFFVLVGLGLAREALTMYKKKDS